MYLENVCGITKCSKFETPIGDLEVDHETITKIHDPKLFKSLEPKDDEAEHSVEMHLPYVFKVMEGQDFKIIPILVGFLSPAIEKKLCTLLVPYLLDRSNLFVISSDFCHWGSRFDYELYDKRYGPIYKYIQHLDKMGMEAIESKSSSAFEEYLEKYKNTICGRHPIKVLLRTMEEAAKVEPTIHQSLKFLQYQQSNRCESLSDSSVSYASASLVLNL